WRRGRAERVLADRSSALRRRETGRRPTEGLPFASWPHLSARGPLRSRLLRCVSLLPPSLGVHAHHEEPQNQRYLSQVQNQKVAEILCGERRPQKAQPGQSGSRKQHAENPR